ncbi:MAG TPA: IS110 family transposase [Solirubrobacterales bacterium]|nr:IS110 family transposase [Solirubrobacterales bacterium]
MITIGIDPHKDTHTAAAVNDASGQLLGELTVPGTDDGHEHLRGWAHELAGTEGGLRFALEDCRHVNGRLERFLLGAGETVLRVGTRMTARSRKTARTVGKSDSIDALAVARAALREPRLPLANHDPTLRELKLLVDHRDDLVSERTAHSMRLRWHLHDLDAGLEPSARLLNDTAVRRGLSQRLRRYGDGVQVRICRELLTRMGELTRAERELRREIADLVRPIAPALLAISGVGDLVAARILVEVGGVGRFPSDAALARHAGCAPIEVSSGRTARHRLSRLGNRKLNATLHVVVLTQARVHPPARAYLAKKRAEGKSNKEAFRCLKRHLVRVVFRALQQSVGVAVSP